MRVDMCKEEGAKTSKMDTKSETLNHLECLTESQWDEDSSAFHGHGH